MTVDLAAIRISDFRSIQGRTTAIPLDAPVVLLHGPNGAGKSTVLSALELALVGEISHIDPQDAEHLVHRGEKMAKITLATPSGAADFTIDGDGVHGSPLLDRDDARFFTERCYLHQRTLGRLLELYEGSGDDGDSLLTAFVNELLGLDELEAVIDGLYPVTDKRRVKQLVPDYREADRELERHRGVIRTLRNEQKEATPEIDEARIQLKELLAVVDAPPALDVDDAAGWLNEAAEHDGRARQDLIAARQELTALTKRVDEHSKRASTADGEVLDRSAAAARTAAEAWRASHGAALEAVLDELRQFLPGVPTSEGATDPSTVRSDALEHVDSELTRLTTSLTADSRARAEVRRLDDAIASAQARLSAIDKQTAASTGVTAAENLAEALAGLVPHVHTEDCPACGRDYSEVSPEPLAAHLAVRISELAAEAERLQELAKARLQAHSDMSKLQSERATASLGVIEPDTKLESQRVAARLESARQQLVQLEPGVAEGAGLVRRATEAERELALAGSHDRRATELRAELEAIATSIGDPKPAQSIALREATASLMSRVAARLETLDRRVRNQRAALGAGARLSTQLASQRQIDEQIASAEVTLKRLEAACKELDRRRAVMRELRDRAEESRVSTVRRVFNNSLNRTWRNLFVRLAPEEPFVPRFRVPDADQRVVAVLETVHRDGKPGGSPAAMLSAGNLNTAALTLFLALNLSVHERLPWILLDDPVQSMDEVHVAHFAALLRTLSKEHKRRVVIAVHERALFDYLSLELSPATPGDRLVTVELRRGPDGSTKVEPDSQEYVPDKALELA